MSYLDKAANAENFVIFDSFAKARQVLRNALNPVCMVSGGADSDIVVDIISKIDTEKRVKYVFFDTGIEYKATKTHLDSLENKYGIKIERVRAKMPVPLGCRKYGVPFWSKHVSEMIERLQRYDFKWEDRPFEELIEEYPKCKSALSWWCNKNKSQFNINHIRGLKEFMIATPPRFKISNKCCKGAKKDVASEYEKVNSADLQILGIRKAEGGARAVAYKTCFDGAENGALSRYRPIFWYSDADKTEYEELFGVTHSDCYVVYGMLRTGCAGCPFGKRFEQELEILEKYEPQLYKAANKIFGESYEYTRSFLKFREEHKELTK